MCSSDTTRLVLLLIRRCGHFGRITKQLYISNSFSPLLWPPSHLLLRISPLALHTTPRPASALPSCTKPALPARASAHPNRLTNRTVWHAELQDVSNRRKPVQFHDAARKSLFRHLGRRLCHHHTHVPRGARAWFSLSSSSGQRYGPEGSKEPFEPFILH